MTEDDPAVRRHEVTAVAEALGRRRARRIEREHLRCKEGAVEAVADCVDADGGDDEPQRVDALAAVEGDRCESESAEQDGNDPSDERDRPW
jgi:hypothetical protein